MDFSQKIIALLKDLESIVKTYHKQLLAFLILFVLLEIFHIPFVSIFLMIFLMAYLSKTKEYKQGKYKVFKFALFFALMIFIIILFLIPASVFLIGQNVDSLELIMGSSLIKISALVGAFFTLLFVFAPYRIFDTNASIFEAMQYSNTIVKNYFFIFIVMVIVLTGLNFVSNHIKYAETIVYMMQVVCMASLYRIGVAEISKEAK